jgi:hypothetical protein
LTPVEDYLEQALESLPSPEIYDVEIEIEDPEIEMVVPDIEDEAEDTEVIGVEDQAVFDQEMEEEMNEAETEESDDFETEDSKTVDYESVISDWGTLFPDYLYYHIQLPGGKLSKYAVVKVAFDPLVEIYLEELPQGSIVRFFYKGFTGEWFKE